MIMNQPFLPNKFVKALDIYDEPPTLYAIMNSIVNFGNENKEKIKDLPRLAKSTIFDFNYPSSGVNFNKDEFEDIFLTHYMFRRINYDTLTSFKLHLKVKLNDIMPKYLKMFEGLSKISFDGTKEIHERTENNSSTGTSSGTTTSNDSTTSDNRFSNTPQNSIQDVKDGEFVSEYTFIQNGSNGTTTSGNTSSTEGEIKEDITITRGDPIEEYSKYLAISDNIYSLIFKECDSLFYGIM